MPNIPAAARIAADAISSADALIITAGAGMGVDSGLPDFRGSSGFWKAYPHAQKLGLSFIDLANPRWFQEDPELAWGFYGHRADLYHKTDPHRGFEILRSWADQKPHGAFVFTSNVDGHFQRSGFPADRVWECHGTVRSLQCSVPCSDRIWPLDPESIPKVHLETFRAEPPLPRCPDCGATARPNILMFGDAHWIPTHYLDEQSAFENWAATLSRSRTSVAIIELGAGTAVPTVRHFSEMKSSALRATLIRINPRESHLNDAYSGIEIPLGALEALDAVQTELPSDSK